ncbi:MAG: decaprenyl-phosphate phosphoribosyltransferase [Actinomycetota bacterium]
MIVSRVSLSDHVKTARPKQWLKNVLVFAAPGAAGVLDNFTSFAPAVAIFVAFCFASSGTYFWNDVLDAEQDAKHPRKKTRPIAAGRISRRQASVVGSLLMAFGCALGYVIEWRAGLAMTIYLVLTTSYSSLFKHVAVIDLMAVASGFVLRAIAGAEATHVEMSNWFLICVSFGALFIVAGKRFAEISEVGHGNSETRATLATYTTDFLRTVVTISLSATLVAYCMWAFATKEISGATWPFYELSIVPMLGALLRYLLVLDLGRGSAPEEVFAADRSLQILGAVWAIIFGLGVYIS